MSRVKRVWRAGERPINLYMHPGVRGLVGIGFRCPGCKQWRDLEVTEKDMHIICPCGLHLAINLEVTLRELEEEEVKGE